MTDHAIKRAKERYNLKLDAKDIKKILKKIKKGEAKQVYYYSIWTDHRDVEYFTLRYNGKLIHPVLCFTNSKIKILTFIPIGKGVSQRRTHKRVGQGGGRHEKETLKTLDI